MKRRRRRLVEGGLGYYHVMSRTVNGESLFGEVEKEVLRRMLWQVAEFSGVRVVTYALMSNHFHLLVEVPPKGEISDAELVRRYGVLYPKVSPWQPLSASALERLLATPSGEPVRRQLVSRMHDVSWLMKTLKQRFSLWYNRTHDRYGPLWSDRFKSVLVEGEKWALQTVAAYIDLNAVRAGLVEDPKDYRYCGYGEAVGGGVRAREGLSVLGGNLSGYRQTLYGVGSETKEGKATVSREEALRVLEKEKGNLPLTTLLRCRVRYFTDGRILGSEAFVREQTKAQPPPASGRPPGPTPMKGANWRGLSTLGGLRKNLFG
ncbi:MAG: transposase [Verrucomicrobiota bacterium]